MKKFWITFGAIAFALILGTGIILLCCLPKAAPLNDRNDPAIEIPVDPETPPENPDNNPDEKEEEKDPSNEQPEDPKPEQPEDPKPEQPTDPIEDEIVGTIIPFSFNDGAIVGYSGSDKEITIPTSYSFGGYKTEETTFENIWDFYDWYHEQRFEWTRKAITVRLANGDDYVIYNSSNIFPELENIEDAFPIIYIDKKEVFVEGNDFQMTSVADNAFENATIEKVIVPEGITHLGNGAFANSTLKEIVLPESLLSIGHSCFSGTRLEHINLPANIKTISSGCFQSCEKLIDIDLSNIETIGDSAFWGCTGLKEVKFSDNLQSIEFAAFFVTESLEVMDIPSSLTEYNTFWNCYDGLKKLILRPNYIFELNYDLSELASHGADIYVPDELALDYKQYYLQLNILPISTLDVDDTKGDEIVGTIIPFSFKDNTITGYTGNESEIVIPTSYSFGGIGKQVRTFNNLWEFEDWWNFDYSEFDNNPKSKPLLLHLANERVVAVYQPSDLSYMENIENLFPACAYFDVDIFVEGNDFQVDTIGGNGFSGKNFEKVEIPYGITTIKSYAFAGCSSLTELSLPNSLIEIEQAGFYKCTALKSLTIPESVTTLGYLAFSECTSITSVVLPKNSVNLGMCIFEHCSGLVYARVESDITKLSNENFAHCTSLKTVELPDNLVEIGGCQFFGCTSLEYIKIPDSVKIIGPRTFNNCTSLVELDLPESLTELKISDNYYKIGLVYNCPSLERIIIRSTTFVDLTELYKSYQYGTRCDIYVADELLPTYEATYPALNFKSINDLI